MLMTEEEARKKWCPQGLSSEREPYCFASECMAWRWFESKNKGNNIPQNESKTLGFCGLAGEVDKA